MKAVVLSIICLTGWAFLISCGNSDSSKSDTATSGHIWISADESLKPIIEAEERVFESIYPKAQIDVIYTSEAEAIKLMLTDSVKLGIFTRQLTPSEKAHFDEIKITPRYSPFATDAIAIIMHNSATDTILTLDQLTHILDGSYSSWKQINSKSADKPLQVVFDNASSGAIRFLQDSLLKGKTLAKHCYAVSSNLAVIDHVSENPNSIGIIGMAWISDQDDSVSHGFLNRIRVVELVPKDLSTAEAPTMKPYQAYVALKQYPLWRTVEMLNCTGRTGLGTGFASFIASDRGQRIVLKSGMVPATAPVRIVKLNNE
jgi:phosphate transport system substrate-binding protein